MPTEYLYKTLYKCGMINIEVEKNKRKQVKTYHKYEGKERSGDIGRASC